MYDDVIEMNKIIRIIINKKQGLEFCSIDCKEAEEFINKLDILKNLPEHSSTQYHKGIYCVFIDEITILKQSYFLIIIHTIQDKHSNFNKVFIDKVTGLYNRNYWEQINDASIYDPADTKDFSLIFIDIDNLKKINDTFGHLTGDKAIEIVGRAIKKSIRKEDLGFRYGGDEFIILLFYKDQKTIYKVVKRIKKAINEMSAEQGLTIDISAGKASNGQCSEMEEIFKMADTDLYREKRQKKEQETEPGASTDLNNGIEKIRSDLNKILLVHNKETCHEEVAKVSKKLDKLIMEYLKNE